MKYNFDTTLDHRRNASYRWGMEDMPENVIGMGTADLDYFCAPCIKEALVPIAEENCYNYRQHTQEYYDAVTGWYERKYGLKVEKEWLSNVPSTIGAVRMALGIYAKPGDAILVQTPVFGPLKWAVGRVFTKEELKRLVDICYENNVKIISDEVHCLVLYGENKHTPILAVSEKAKEISVQIVSLSKGYTIMSMPHAIITVAEPKMREAWMRQIQAYSFGYAVNSFAIAAVTSIMKGEADEWMTELTQYLYQNLQETLDFIKENNLPLVPYVPEGSFLLWLDCKNAGIGTKQLDKFFMEKAQIHLDDGEENFGPEGEGFVRINFAVTNRTLKEALNRIRAAFDER